MFASGGISLGKLGAPVVPLALLCAVTHVAATPIHAFETDVTIVADATGTELAGAAESGLTSSWHHQQGGWQHRNWTEWRSDRHAVGAAGVSAATSTPTPTPTPASLGQATVEEEVEIDQDVDASSLDKTIVQKGGVAVTSTLSSTRSSQPVSTSLPGSNNSTIGANSTSTTTTPSSSSQCKCGYSLSAFNDAYYPSLAVLDAATLSSTADLSALGWSVTTNGGGIGGGYNDVRASGQASNVRLNSGTLELVVPGGQSASSGTITGAELAFGTALVSAHVTMEAQLSDVVGSCQSIFTYHDGKLAEGKGDELDIEVVGIEKGLQVTNWDPDTPSDAGAGKQDSAVNDFPADPASAFNRYTIAWSQSSSSSPAAQYLFNDIPLAKQPTKYASVNPSKVILNNWSNSDPGFTAGPPTEDVVMKVKRVTVYYTPADVTPGELTAGCQQSDVCVV